MCIEFGTPANYEAFSFRGLHPPPLIPHQGLYPWTPLEAAPRRN